VFEEVTMIAHHLKHQGALAAIEEQGRCARRRGLSLSVVCGRGSNCDRMIGEEESEMTKRIPITPAPDPLETYAKHFDGLLGKSNQREGFRQYLEGLLLPSERHKT
jgi:hypothetical protein